MTGRREPVNRGVGAFQLAAGVLQVLGGVVALSVWTSRDFAADFDGGTRTGHFAGDAWLATLAAAGAFLAAVAALVADRQFRRAGVSCILLLGSIAVAVLALPLLAHYASASATRDLHNDGAAVSYAGVGEHHGSGESGV